MEISLDRTKPRRVWIALAHRIYYAIRGHRQREWLLRLFLNTAWLTKRLAWEEAHRLIGTGANFDLRPHVRTMIEAAIKPHDTVIDFGCGRGQAAELAAKKAGRVLAVDHDPRAVHYTATRCRDLPNVIVTVDWSDALGDTQADVGLLLHMLEHLAEPEQTLRTLRRWCQRLLIEVPDVSADPLNLLRHELGTPLYSDADHVTEFTPEYLHSTLQAAGWDIQKIDRAYGALIATAVQSNR